MSQVYGMQNIEFIEDETAIAPVTLYVATTGNDSNDGLTSGTAFRTIARALRDMPARCLYTRTIQLGIGSFDFPTSYSMASSPTFGFVLQGTVSVTAPWNIAAIGVSDRDNGLQLQLTGAAFAADEHVGRIVQFSGGALNSAYGVIYHNTADTIWVTSSTASFIAPAPGDAVQFRTNESTINLNTTSPNRTWAAHLWFQINDCLLTGGYFGMDLSSLVLTRCSATWEQTSIGPKSLVYAITSYLASDTSLANCLTVGEYSRFSPTAGTVVDGLTATKMQVLKNGLITPAGECVFANLDAGGLEIGTATTITPFNDNTNDTLRFYGCAGGVTGTTVNGYCNIIFPYLAGSVTANELVSMQGLNNKVVFTGGTVATGTTPNAILLGSTLFYGNIQGNQGADVASANDMSIGTDGNYFDITGNTQINTISATSFKAGTMVTLQFDANPVVKHATAGAGAQLLLSGAADFNTSADDTLTVIYDGTYWREISRAVI